MDFTFTSMITDTADASTMGGPIKIDSVQNVIMLRSDLHDAWDNYEFGVDPPPVGINSPRRTIIALPPLRMATQISMAAISD